MTSKKLLKQVLESLEEHKALDILSLDIKYSDIADYMVICSGTSKRHVHSIGESLVEDMKKAGIKPLGVEDDPDGTWTLVDLTDVIVHIMQPETREFYQLEKLWGAELAKQQRDKKS